MKGLNQHHADLALLLARWQADSAPCWPGISSRKMPGWLSTRLTWHFCWRDGRLTRHPADLAFFAGKMTGWLSTLLTWHYCWQDDRLTQRHAKLAFLLAKCQAYSAPCWPGISACTMPGWLSTLLTWHFYWQDARLTRHLADLAILLARCQADSAPCWPGISAGKMPGLVHHPAGLVLTASRLTWYPADLVLPAARLTSSALEYFSSSWPTDLNNSAYLVLAATSPVGRMAWPSLKMAAMLNRSSTCGIFRLNIHLVIRRNCVILNFFVAVST